MDVSLACRSDQVACVSDGVSAGERRVLLLVFRRVKLTVSLMGLFGGKRVVLLIFLRRFLAR